MWRAWLPGILAAMMACSGSSALHVLLVSTLPSHSHYILANTLAIGLLGRGHHVTELVLQQPAALHPNRTSFVMQTRAYDVDPETPISTSVLQEVPLFYGFGRETTRQALESPAFQNLVNHLRDKQPHFDVFVLDYLLQEPLIGLNDLIGRRPVVILAPFNMPEAVLELMGCPYWPSLLPYGGVGVHDGQPMNLAERVMSAFKWAAYKSYFHWTYRPWVQEAMVNAFPGVPPLEVLLQDVAVSLVNTVPVLNGGMPLVPGVVEVGGLQAKPASLVPDDIRGWLDNATHGFVFMSFGSNVKSASMSGEKKGAILGALGRLQQRVLWKYEGADILDVLPPNVRVSKWLPQNDILGHPNIVCFVSHNGGLSSQEAAYHGVPVLGVPFFFDHVGYAEKFERLGVGRRLRYSDITESTFHDALVSIIHDPRYRERMQRLRQLMCDQKEPPLERALWWVEHVARTAGAPHLRSPALRLHWYELWMLDLLAGAAIALLAVLVAICALWRLCARPVSGPGTAAGLKVKVG